MRFVLLYQSLVSDWNHGNAHFLRGVIRELAARGHEVRVWEPADGWSRTNLLAGHGPAALERFHAAFPGMESRLYDPATLDLDEALDGADVVIVHEWTDPALAARLGRLRGAGSGFRLLFHDTHHRSVSDAAALAATDLSGFDGVLAFGEAVRERYLRQGWTGQSWTWHEAADTALFQPLPEETKDGDLVWIGNWGDGERSEELVEFLLAPVRGLRLRARLHGVRYPEEALAAVARAGAEYAGWLPNFEVPRAFARHRVTVHVPRRPYVEALPGIPTIRVFEALACGIPLVSAPWQDAEGLFSPGIDFLMARDGAEVTRMLYRVLHDAALAAELSARGLETILARHTCAHRVDELLDICRRLGVAEAMPVGEVR